MRTTEGRNRTSWDVVCKSKVVLPRTSENPENKGELLYGIVLGSTRLERQGLTTHALILQGNVDYIKCALDYATIWCAFINFFSFENVLPCILKYDNCNTIRSWKTLRREFTCKVISTVNILHTYLSFLALSLHSHSLILRYWIIPNYIHHPMICLRGYSNCGLANGFFMMSSSFSFVLIKIIFYVPWLICSLK